MRAPIFIIGYPRSGTSFVGKLVSRFTEYPSHGESHALTLLQELHHQINLYHRRADFTGRELVKELDLESLKSLNTKFFREFYLKTYGSECFVDKTPGAVACHGWGVVKQAFPTAVFLACVRSPVEVYESASLKFTKDSGKGRDFTPLDIAQGWVSAMNGIEKLSKSEFSDDLHVVSQLELRSEPDSALQSLFDFLEISTNKIRPALEMCRRSREDVLTNNIDNSAYKSLNQSDLNIPTIEAFRQACEQTCRNWNIIL